MGPLFEKKCGTPILGRGGGAENGIPFGTPIWENVGEVVLRLGVQYI